MDNVSNVPLNARNALVSLTTVLFALVPTRMPIHSQQLLVLRNVLSCTMLGVMSVCFVVI